jgi:hypothetical protein
MPQNITETHTKFSQLVRDDTLLKPRLRDETLQKDIGSVQEAYKRMIESLHDEVSEALRGENLKTQLEDGETRGLRGMASGEEFDIDALIADITGHESVIDTEDKYLQDYYIRTVGDDEIPDEHFVAFLERKTLYGRPSSGADSTENDRRYTEMRREMEQLNEQIRNAHQNGDTQRAQELSNVFYDLKQNFRSGEPAPRTTNTEPKSPERAQDAPPPGVDRS